jgi:signal transduction histidine kinase
MPATMHRTSGIEAAARATSTPAGPLVAEALTNISKHAHATRASVTVDATDGTLVAEIVDDGVGGAHPGSGLRGLADRMEAVGGTLSVESPPGRGTRVRAHAPRATAAAQDAA